MAGSSAQITDVYIEKPLGSVKQAKSEDILYL